MRFTQHLSNNAVLAPPEGATNEQCRPLPITRVQYPDGELGTWSFWMPSAEDLKLLQAGRPIILCMMGAACPPAALLVSTDESTGFL